MRGIGFNWDGFYHGFIFGLLDDISKPAVWESPSVEIPFVSNLTANYGLLGMDTIRQWDELLILPNPSKDGGKIKIVIGGCS